MQETDADYRLQVRERLAMISQRIRKAQDKAGRSHDAVRLIAVTKYVDVERVRALRAEGLEDFGENRWQSASAKVEALPEASWHFIGPLQRNKAAAVLRHFRWIHSVDRPQLADEIGRIAREQGRPVTVLLQVNVSGEQQKSGVAPEAALDLLRRCAAQSGLAVRGLMAIGRQVDDPEDARRDFVELRLLRDRLQTASGLALPELSMGMSGDFDIAVEEGATMVRVGRLLVAPEARQ
ncbi:MAG: YggS family pyridoxal phosphate-dependent enzyme [Bacilli bacterium]